MAKREGIETTRRRDELASRIALFGPQVLQLAGWTAAYCLPFDAVMHAVTGATLIACGALALGLLGWVPPLLVWRAYREQPGRASEHARQALNFQLTALVLLVVAMAAAWRAEARDDDDLPFGEWTFLAWFALPLTSLGIATVMGVRALQDERSWNPLAIPFLRRPRRNRIRTKESGGEVSPHRVQ